MSAFEQGSGLSRLCQSAAGGSPAGPVHIVCGPLERWISSRATDYMGWIDIADDDIDFISAAEGREPAGFTRRRNRKAQLFEYFQSLASLLEMQQFDVDELFGADDTVIVISSSAWRVRANGRLVRMRALMHFRFRGEKVVRFENIYDTAALLAALAPERPGERR